MADHINRPGRKFSAGYHIIPGVDIVTWPRKRAVMVDDLYKLLAVAYGQPLDGKVENRTYTFAAEGGLPSRTIAVPEENHQTTPDALLIPK